MSKKNKQNSKSKSQEKRGSEMKKKAKFIYAVVGLVLALALCPVLAFGDEVSTEANDSEETTAQIEEAVYPDAPAPQNDLERFVWRLYEVCLDRVPDKIGFESQMKSLAAGTPPAEIAYNFLDSNEFDGHNYSNSERVERVYQTMFGRASDPDGKAFWKDYLDCHMSIRSVVAGFSQADEYKAYFTSMGVSADTIQIYEARDRVKGVTAFASRLYEEVLGRCPEPRGLDEQCYAIISGMPCYQIAMNFFGSKEFANQGHSWREMVAIGYEAILGRSITENEYSYWLNRLYNEGLDCIIFGLCQSDEFEAICQKCGMSSGARGASSPTPHVAHSHDWKPVYTQTYVVDKEAWEELQYEEVELCICNGCGADITGCTTSHFKEVGRGSKCFAWHSEVKRVQVGTITHPEEGHYENVLDHYECDGCGESK